MLKEHGKLLVQLHILADLTLTVIAFGASYYFRKGDLPFGEYARLNEAPNYFVVLLLIIIIWFLCLYLGGAYDSYRRRRLSIILLNMVRAVFLGMCILFFLLYLIKFVHISRLMMGLFFIFDIVLLSINKTIVFRMLNHLRSLNYNIRRLLIIGTRERAKDVLTTIAAHPGSGFRVLGCLEISREMIGQEVADGCMVLDTIDRLEKFLSGNVVDELIFAMPLSMIPESDKYVTLAANAGVATRIMPDRQVHYLQNRPEFSSIKIEPFFDFPTIVFRASPSHESLLLIKSMGDYIMAACLLFLLSPLMALIGIAIKTISPGPILFRQERLGLNRRPFYLYKFRTMINDADKMVGQLQPDNEADGPAFKIKNDPRIIPHIGHILRQTGLDEMPQLINILRGEMSFVGPRPPLAAEVDNYQWWQRRRLSMKPGLTCLWQISPNRNDIPFEKWMKMDLAYIDNWSLWLDMKILFGTVKTVLTGAGR